MRLNRKKLRRLLEEEQLRALLELKMKQDKPKRKPEMRQFAETHGGSTVIKEGRKILASGRKIREMGNHQTGKMSETVDKIGEFVEKLGEGLSDIGSINEGGTVTESLPTMAEFKTMIKEIQRLEK